MQCRFQPPGSDDYCPVRTQTIKNRALHAKPASADTGRTQYLWILRLEPLLIRPRMRKTSSSDFNYRRNWVAARHRSDARVRRNTVPEYAYSSAIAIAESIRHGEASSREVLDYFLARVDRLEKPTNCVVIL